MQVALDNPFPQEVVGAVDLCKVSQHDKDWGIVSAAWVLPDGSPKPGGGPGQAFALGHGVVPNFGPNVAPRQGTRVLLLPNGTARRPNDPGYQSPEGFSKGYEHGAPEGFPKESASCPGGGVGVAARRDGALGDGPGAEERVRVLVRFQLLRVRFPELRVLGLQ